MQDSSRILESIYELYKAGKLDAAEEQLKSISGDNKNIQTIHLEALIALDKGNLAHAGALLQDGLRLNPRSHDLLVTLGTVFALLHDPSKAELAFRAASDVSGGSTEANIKLALLHLDNQNPQEALPLLHKLHKGDAANKLVLKAYIIALKECERNEDALAVLEEHWINSERDEDLSYLRGQILFQLGLIEESITAYRELLDSGRYAADSVKNIAQILRMVGQSERLDVFLNEVTTNPKKDSGVPLVVAKILHALGRSAYAEKILATVPQNDKSFAEVLSIQGRIKADNGHHQEAYSLTRRALESRPGDLNLMTEFANAAMLSGKVNEAMETADLALVQKPNNQFWMAMRATGGRKLGTDYKFYFDYEKYVKSFELEAPDGYASIVEFNQALIKTLLELHNFTNAPLDQSVRKGAQTSPNLIHYDSPVLNSFFDAVKKPIHEYLASIGNDQNHPLQRRNFGDARICSAWSVLLGKGGHHADHIHPEGWISAAYYVCVPEEVNNGQEQGGWIRFGKPQLDLGMDAEYYVQPKAGRLVMFPSYLWHGTIPLKEESMRLTIPFDMLPAKRTLTT